MTKKFEAIIAYGENGDGWILQRSQDAIDADLLPGGNSTFDNNVEIYGADGTGKLSPEMQIIHVELYPWSYHDSITGEIEGGCEGHLIKVLWDYDFYKENENE